MYSESWLMLFNYWFHLVTFRFKCNYCTNISVLAFVYACGVADGVLRGVGIALSQTKAIVSRAWRSGPSTIEQLAGQYAWGVDTPLADDSRMRPRPHLRSQPWPSAHARAQPRSKAATQEWREHASSWQRRRRLQTGPPA